MKDANKEHRILFIGPHSELHELVLGLAAAVKQPPLRVSHADGAGEAERMLSGAGSTAFTLAVVDTTHPAYRGLAVVQRVNDSAPALSVLLITRDATEAFSETAVRMGVLDMIPASSLNSVSLQRLVMLAAERKRLLERVEQISLVDPLTKMANQRGFIAFTRKQIELARRLGRDLVVLIVRPQHGEEEGPWLALSADENTRQILELADILKHVFRGSDVIGRLDADFFAVCAIQTGEAPPGIMAERVRKRTNLQNAAKAEHERLTVEIGQSVCSPGLTRTAKDLLQDALQDLRQQGASRKT